MRKLCSRWLIIIMRSNGALLSSAHSQYSFLQGQLASTRLVELHKTEVDTKTWGKVSIYTERKCVSMQPNSHWRCCFFPCLSVRCGRSRSIDNITLGQSDKFNLFWVSGTRRSNSLNLSLQLSGRKRASSPCSTKRDKWLSHFTPLKRFIGSLLPHFKIPEASPSLPPPPRLASSQSLIRELLINPISCFCNVLPPAPHTDANINSSPSLLLLLPASEVLSVAGRPNWGLWTEQLSQ